MTGVGGLAFSPDGKRLAITCGDRTARVWTVETGAEITALRHAFGVQNVEFSPDSARLATVSADGARLWDVVAGTEIAFVADEGFDGCCLAFSSDGTRLAIAIHDNRVRLFDAATAAEIAVLRGHKGEIKRTVFSANSTRLATGSSDHTVQLWDASTGEATAVLRGHEGEVRERRIFAGWGASGYSSR